MIATTSEDPANVQVEAPLQVLNVESLLERCVGDVGAAVALLGMFFDRLPQAIAEISAELADCQARAQVLRKVHTLKGNAGNLSADRLYQATSRLESALRREEFADLPLRLLELQKEAEAVRCAIPSVLETWS
jgi:HPt (histidine-containing phosphotransfer) domain-containing protein